MSDPTELAKLLGGRLIERRDAKAQQFSNGSYMPVRESMKDSESPLLPWKFTDLLDHISERATYGHYIVSLDNTCRMFAFDIDLRQAARPHLGEEPIMFEGEEIDPRAVWASGENSAVRKDLIAQMFAMTQGLAERVKNLVNIPVLMSFSGSKGMHVYGLLDPGTSADDARETGRLVLDSFEGDIVPEHGNNFFKHSSGYPALSIELFPKQDTVGNGGFGNLMRLPLGKNLKTNKPSFFLVPSTDLLRIVADDPMAALQEGSLR